VAQKELAEGDEPFAVAEVVLASLLRIVTNARIFDPPTPMKTAFAFCQQLVECPRAALVVGLCTDIQSPLVTDAYLAALAIEHGCELIDHD
jgi:predicted nucleic acid-binding protein